MTPPELYANHIRDIADHLIELQKHLAFAASMHLVPATVAKCDAAMSKVGMKAREIYQAALDAQVECGIVEMPDHSEIAE